MKRFLVDALCTATLVVTLVQDAQPAAPADGTHLLEQSRARYSTLRSYADTATILTEYRSAPNAPTLIERHRLQTRYRAPRAFFLQFDEDPKAGAERFVIWCDGGDFQSWWSATGVHEAYDGGRGALAFALGDQPTRGATVLIAPLLFSQAQMKGPLTILRNARLEGTESIDGRPAHRISAEAQETYANGYTLQSRAAMVWLDQQTLLVLKLVLDTPRGTGAGMVDRTTVTFEPRVDPALTDEQFRFAVPGTALSSATETRR